MNATDWYDYMDKFVRTDDTCPHCGGANLLFKRLTFVEWTSGPRGPGCGDCGWYHLSIHPCRVCDKPARDAAGVPNGSLFGCADHPITTEEIDAAFAERRPS